MIDLTNKKFGRLLVLEKTNLKSKNGALWKCKCDCGNILNVAKKHLLYGHSRSCGCYAKKIASEKAKKYFSIAAEKNYVEGTNLLNLTCKVSKRNKSGFKGVCWDTKRNRWRASICFSRKNKNLGYFEKIEDAVDARKKAEELYYKPILEKYKGL